MDNTKVGVVGYGTIGMRLADGVEPQKDMDLVGVADVQPTLDVRTLVERDMPYDFYAIDPDRVSELEEVGVEVSGNFDDLLEQIDVALDASPAGIGAKNKEKYEEHDVKAIFQGGEETEVANVFFHGYANYEEGIGQDYLKLTSCNTTGLIRSVDIIDRGVGVEKVYMTIVRRSADPGETQRGQLDNLKMEPIPSHQATDLMHIMPHIDCTGLLVHTPVTHGHIITLSITPKEDISKEKSLDLFRQHPRIKVVRIADGFDTNTSLFNWSRHSLKTRADMYEIAVFEETIGFSGDDLVFAINIPQQPVIVPETIDGVRACMEMQMDREEAVKLTNKYLEMPTTEVPTRK